MFEDYGCGSSVLSNAEGRGGGVIGRRDERGKEGEGEESMSADQLSIIERKKERKKERETRFGLTVTDV